MTRVLGVCSGVSIDCVDDDGWAPIHWAVHQSNLEVLCVTMRSMAIAHYGVVVRLVWCDGLLN